MLNAKAYALSVRDDTSFRVEGGSDSDLFSIAKVTINNLGDGIGTFAGAVIDSSGYCSIYNASILGTTTTDVNVIMYNGNATVSISVNASAHMNITPTVTGSITLDPDSETFLINGDGTITVAIIEDNLAV